MACVTLKRRLDLSPLHDGGVNSSVGPETGCAPICKKRFLRPAFSANSGRPPCKETWKNPLAAWQKFEKDLKPLVEGSPFSARQGAAGISTTDVVNGIYKKYRQMKRRQAVVEANAKAELSQSSNLGQLVASTSNLPSMDINDAKSSSEQPLLTVKQVTLICQQLLKEQEDSIRAEYESVLLNKLSEQYETFVKFNQDQLKKLYESHAMSYVS